MARTDPQVNFRMPQALRDELEQASKLSNRTLSAEIVARLQQSFDATPSDEALKAKLEAAEKTIESHESHEFAIRWVSIIKDSLLAALLKTAEDADVQAPAVDLARQFLDAQEEKNLDGLGKVMDKILGISSSRRRKSGASVSPSADGLSKKDLETIILAKSQEVSRLLRGTTKPLEEEG